MPFSVSCLVLQSFQLGRKLDTICIIAGVFMCVCALCLPYDDLGWTMTVSLLGYANFIFENINFAQCLYNHYFFLLLQGKLEIGRIISPRP